MSPEHQEALEKEAKEVERLRGELMHFVVQQLQLNRDGPAMRLNETLAKAIADHVRASVAEQVPPAVRTAAAAAAATQTTVSLSDDDVFRIGETLRPLIRKSVADAIAEMPEPVVQVPVVQPPVPQVVAPQPFVQDVPTIREEVNEPGTGAEFAPDATDVDPLAITDTDHGEVDDEAPATESEAGFFAKPWTDFRQAKPSTKIGILAAIAIFAAVIYFSVTMPASETPRQPPNYGAVFENPDGSPSNETLQSGRSDGGP